MWLKGLALELESEDPGARCVSLPILRTDANFRARRSALLIAVKKPFRLTADLCDRLLIARLEIDSQAMSYVCYRQ